MVAYSSAPRTKNVASFFQDMEDALKEKQREIDEEESELHARYGTRRRARRLSGRSGSQANLGGEQRGAARTSPGSQPPGGCSYRSKRFPSVPIRPKASVVDVAAGASLYLQEWMKHDLAWQRFQAEPPCPLSAIDVPWPPCGDDILEFCEKLSAPGCPKQAYRIACKRWHPDKFLQRYGSSIVPDDLPALTLRLNETFQAVTNQWDRRNHAAQHRS
mmetsp:Transcript_44523/g.100329  ORF Transcript_44523/g.100329 Transcript_44523/m.100329 type:complete len:217 (-) Transcript_44523:78-728(-)